MLPARVPAYLKKRVAQSPGRHSISRPTLSACSPHNIQDVDAYRAFHYHINSLFTAIAVDAAAAIYGTRRGSAPHPPYVPRVIVVHRGTQLPPLIPVLYPPLVQHVVAQGPDGVRLHGLDLDLSIRGRFVRRVLLEEEIARPLEFGPDHRPEGDGFRRRSRCDVRDESKEIAVELDGGTLRWRHIIIIYWMLSYHGR
jgi:hypothetical protein